MDVSKVKRSMNKDHLPERIPVHGGYSGRGGSGGGAMRGGGGHEDMRVQFEELKDMNRMYRTQMQTLQSERDKTLENNRMLNDSVHMLRRKIDEIKFEKAEMQKVLEQKGFQRNQMDHEKLAKHYDQLCGQMKMMQHEREQIEQRHQQEKHELEAQLIDKLRSVKLNLEDAERDRDSLKFKLAERKRELERVREQLTCLGPNQETNKELAKILEDRNALRLKMVELKQERQTLQDKLASATRTIESLKASSSGSQQGQASNLQQQLHSVRKDRDDLVEVNNDLRRNLDTMEMQQRETENECHRLRQNLMDSHRGISPSRKIVYDRTSSGNLYSGPSRERSQGSTDEDLNMSSDASDHPSSFSDLTSLTRTSSGQSGSLLLHTSKIATDKGSNRKNLGKLSASTSSLSNEMQGKFPEQGNLPLQKVIRLEKSLEEAKKDNLNLNSKVSELEAERGDLSSQLESTKKQCDDIHKELTSASSKFKEAQSQIDMLDKEKGVALRDNAASYEQFIQLQTQLREFKAEKQIAEQQKDIAKKELDRVITESVNTKKKLETIMIQRSKDAKDLSAMRHIKDKTVQEMTELRKKLEQLQKINSMMEEEAGTIKEVIHRAVQKISTHSRKGGCSSNLMHSWETGGGAGGEGGDGSSMSMLRDLGVITETLQQLENDRRVIVRKLFPEGGAEQSKSLNDIVLCIDGFIHDRRDLQEEVDALHQSSSKLSEQRIFELKQKLEDIMTENRSLKKEVNSRSHLLVKAEQNRDQLSAECSKLDLQLQQLKNRYSKLVEDHDKTLERVAERWKQNWPMEWDDGWEEKHVTVTLDSEGYAGFSVVGGCDQPQLPSPGAFFITMVNQGGPAESLLKPGDVLESINGISLSNSYHRDAVRAVKESKRSLAIGFRRRRHASHLLMGLVQPILSVPHLSPTNATPTNLAPPPSNEKPEQFEYSLYIDSKEKSDLGFRYDWSVVCKVSEVKSSGPADQILKPGDRILKINETTIMKEKPSVVKKLMKPHKNILKLTIERPSKQEERTYMGQPPPAKDMALTNSTFNSWSPKLQPGGNHMSSMEGKRGQSWSGDHTPNYSSKHSDDFTNKSLSSHASFSALDRIGLHERAPPTKDYSRDRAGSRGEGGASYMPYAKSRSHESYGSRDSKEGFSQDTQSQDSGSRPTKLGPQGNVGVSSSNHGSAHPTSVRHASDGGIYGESYERRMEYDLTSERSDSQYSQSESYLSESSYDYGLSSSQSIDLTFHTVSTIPTHNRLTVDTMMTTQAPTQPQQHSEDEEGGVGFLARDDACRTTFRTRNSSDPSTNSNGNNSESGTADRPESSQSQSLSQEFSRDRRMYGMGIRRKGGKQKQHQKSSSSNGARSLSKLSSSDQNLTKTSSNLAMRGRSRSQLSLGRAPSMTSVMEEPPRKSISTTDMSSYEHDPLADASYIRANFTYTPRNPKELSIKAGDVFHIHDEAPSERFRSSFWVSRLNEDGTDEQIGAIPNSIRGQEYLNDQGETLDFELYEEVEPYTGLRPVVILGALADQVMTALLENLPNMFYQCEKTLVSNAGRLTEARLGRELSEKKIIDFSCRDGGFEILKLVSITTPPSKTKHCLMTGSPRAIQTLKAVAPPISIVVKALTPESITTFSPEPISMSEAKNIFETTKDLEENHANEFTGSLFLIYMETLMGQIEDIITAEKRKQAWVPVSRPEAN